MFEKLLREIAQEIATLAPDKIGAEEVLKILQRNFSPYEDKPRDTFLKKINFDSGRPRY